MNSIAKWFIILFSFIAISAGIFGLFLWLTTSSQIANAPLAVTAKYDYYFNLAPKLGVNLKDLPFEIIPMRRIDSPEGPVYIYIILGRYQGIDFEDQIIYLSTKSGAIYGYKFSSNADEPIPYKDLKAGGSQISELGVSPFIQGEVLSIQWEDDRTLSKILSDSKTDSLNLVNPDMDFSGFQLINKVPK